MARKLSETAADDELPAGKHDKLRLEVQGILTIEQLAIAVSALADLVAAAIGDRGAVDGVSWIVSGLKGGSADVAVRGQNKLGKPCDAVYSAVEACVEISRDISIGKYPEYATKSLLDPFRRLSGLAKANTLIPEVNLSCNGVSYPISKLNTLQDPIELEDIEPSRTAYGMVRGSLQKPDSAKGTKAGLKFVIYDAQDEHTINCIAGEAQMEIVRKHWGKNVEVEGFVTRDSAGRPQSVDRVSSIAEIKHKQYRDDKPLAGSMPRRKRDLTVEEALRSGRDGQE